MTRASRWRPRGWQRPTTVDQRLATSSKTTCAGRRQWAVNAELTIDASRIILRVGTSLAAINVTIICGDRCKKNISEVWKADIRARRRVSTIRRTAAVTIRVRSNNRQLREEWSTTTDRPARSITKAMVTPAQGDRRTESLYCISSRLIAPEDVNLGIRIRRVLRELSPGLRDDLRTAQNLQRLLEHVILPVEVTGIEDDLFVPSGSRACSATSCRADGCGKRPQRSCPARMPHLRPLHIAPSRQPGAVEELEIDLARTDPSKNSRRASGQRRPVGVWCI